MEALIYTPKEIRFIDRKVDGLFRRYGIPEETDQVLATLVDELEIEASFFVDLVQAYLDPSSIREENFLQYSVPVLVDYLHRSHRYYLNDRLPKMGQYIHLIISDHQKKHPLLKILSDFFTPYCNHLEQHIEEEESNLFPYALDLYNNVSSGKTSPSILMSAYSVLDFAQHHDDTETVLRQVKQIIDFYSPTPTSRSPYRILSNLLHHFEEDLKIHAMIEDQILVPKLWKLETEWAEQRRNR